MLPYFTSQFGNPHSRDHMYGWEAQESVDMARETIASFINSNPNEIYFTSGATESNNIALMGTINYLHQYYKDTKKLHAITVLTEHSSVLEVFNELEKYIEVTYLPVDDQGMISLEQIKNAIRDNTVLLSAMMVNNEIGVVFPIKEIGKICKENNILFHTDAAQSFGKLKIDLRKDNIDLMSISGHKNYASKGIGALYIKNRVRVKPIVYGGNQEASVRSGTLAVSLIMGLAKSTEIAYNNLSEEQNRILSLRNLLYEGLKSRLNIKVNGCLHNRLAGNLNISFLDIQQDHFISSLRKIAISSGSACRTSHTNVSHVLKALNIEKKTAENTIRFGLGRFTTAEDINYAIDVITDSVK